MTLETLNGLHYTDALAYHQALCSQIKTVSPSDPVILVLCSTLWLVTEREADKYTAIIEYLTNSDTVKRKKNGMFKIKDEPTLRCLLRDIHEKVVKADEKAAYKVIRSLGSNDICISRSCYF